MHTSIKIQYLRTTSSLQTLVFTLQFKCVYLPVSECNHIRDPRGIKWRLLSSWLERTQKPNTLDKSFKLSRVN